MSQPQSMRGWHLANFVKSLKDLKVTTVPVPTATGEALVIRTTHVSPTHVDLLYARGLHQNNRRHAKPPFTLGTDFAGVVVASPRASRFRRGDRVYGSAPQAFAEYIVIDLAQGAHGVRHVPKDWSNRQACAAGASATISLGCFEHAGGIKPGTWVLVTGATGGLGVMAIQVAKAQGAKVIALVGDEEKAAALSELGVVACVSYHEEDWVADVRRLADGKGVDVVYDAVGMVDSCLRVCRHNGKVIIVGFAGRGGNMEEVKMNRILLKSASVVGYRFGEHGRQDPVAVNKLWSRFDALVERRKIIPVVFPKDYNGIEAVLEALQDLEKHKVWGRAVVTICENNETKEITRSRL